MKPKHYVALLRGINVGGSNIIKMAELKSAFEKLGFEIVATYIQSGNVLFETNEKNATTLSEKIEHALSKKFNYEFRVVLVSHTALAFIVTNAPKHFGADPDAYRYDALFLKPPLTAAKAIKSVPVKEGVDQVFVGKGVLYFTRLIAKASQSKLTRIVQMPLYQNMTGRNWNTTTKLLALLNSKSNAD